MKDHRQFLSGVRKVTGFLDWVNDVEAHCPKIPPFDTTDQGQKTETWVYYSGMKAGYKLALSHLGVKLDE